MDHYNGAAHLGNAAWLPRAASITSDYWVITVKLSCEKDAARVQDLGQEPCALRAEPLTLASVLSQMVDRKFPLSLQSEVA